jgi:sulfite reductase (ferredoxin)
MAKIRRTAIDKMIAQARAKSPLEACGYLGEKEGVLAEAFGLRNVDASPEHFSFEPAEQFAALRQMRAAGLRPRAVYHSHPASPARPSAEDIRLTNDPGPYVFALTSRLIAESDSWLLPRKYKIAFSNTAEDTARATLNDLGFVALKRSGVRGFAVYVAGGQGGKPQIGHLLHEFVPDTEVYFIAEAIKRLFHKHGNRKNRHAARLRFLWNSLGEKQFVELYEHKREQLRREQAEPLALAPVQLAASSQPRAAGSALPAGFEKWRQRFVTEQKQSGLFTVLVPVLLGNLPTAAALALAEFLIPLGEDVFRATIEQNLQLRNIPEGMLPAAYEVIRGITPLASEPRIMGSAVACTGASTCKLGVCLPRGALSATVRRLQASGLDLDRLADVRINLSGCPNSCGAHLTADLGFFGRVGRVGQTSYPAYEVVAGARLGHGTSRLAEPVGTIAAHDLPAFVVDALGRYLAQSDARPFSDYFAGPGKQELVKLCQKYKDVPTFEDDKNCYFDWGATEVFSLAGRGIAECSAGLFDLIEIDLNRIKELRHQRDAAPAQAPSDRDIYETVLLAARMLLITRGVEAQSEKEVFALYRRHFIDTGLVPAQYVPLLDAASENDNEGLRLRAGEAFALADFMADLYAKMDNSLRFPGETVAALPNAATSGSARHCSGRDM